MDPIPATKHEHIDSQTVYKKVKKEEDTAEVTPQQQQQRTYMPMMGMPYFPYFPPPMPMGWYRNPMANPMPYPYMPMVPPGYGYGPMPSSYTAKKPVKKPFKILRNVRPFKLKYINVTEKIVKPDPVVIKKEEGQPVPEPVVVAVIPEVKKIRRKKGKKTVRVSACKNYIGLLCAGFSRAVLTSDRHAAIIKQAEVFLEEKRSRIPNAEHSSKDELVHSFKTYIHKNICGKRVKKSNRERDFKVRNTEELDGLLMPKPEDNALSSVMKEMLRDMFSYFFNSEYYTDWLAKGMISESNRVFFVRNKKEILRKFLNPAFYKPKFNHNQDKEILINN